jgi:hypothetical protein
MDPPDFDPLGFNRFAHRGQSEATAADRKPTPGAKFAEVRCDPYSRPAKEDRTS